MPPGFTGRVNSTHQTAPQRCIPDPIQTRLTRVISQRADVNQRANLACAPTKRASKRPRTCDTQLPLLSAITIPFRLTLLWHLHTAGLCLGGYVYSLLGHSAGRRGWEPHRCRRGTACARTATEVRGLLAIRRPLLTFVFFLVYSPFQTPRTGSGDTPFDHPPSRPPTGPLGVDDGPRHAPHPFRPHARVRARIHHGVVRSEPARPDRNRWYAWGHR